MLCSYVFREFTLMHPYFTLHVLKRMKAWKVESLPGTLAGRERLAVTIGLILGFLVASPVWKSSSVIVIVCVRGKERVMNNERIVDHKNESRPFLASPWRQPIYHKLSLQLCPCVRITNCPPAQLIFYSQHVKAFCRSRGERSSREGHRVLFSPHPGDRGDLGGVILYACASISHVPLLVKGNRSQKNPNRI